MAKKILLSFIFFPFFALLVSQAQISQKKIIEFGWDYPTVKYLLKHINQMGKKPFDGVVFSFDFKVYDAFDTLHYPDSVFQFEQLRKLKWGALSDNFIFVRGESPNGAEWLSDNSWNNISANLKNISKSVQLSRAKGILFDPEYYIPDSTKNPWKYSSELYSGLSYDQVGAFVKKRGKQFIQSLQSYSPDIKILFTWMFGLVAAQNNIAPIQKTDMGLIPFFIQGVLEGANDKCELIDGNEFSYGYMESAHFIWAGERIRASGRKYIKDDFQSKWDKISIAQAVFFDGIMATSSALKKGYDTATKKRWLYSNLYDAMKTTDKYVWFYNEKINWWKNQVDSGISNIIIKVKNRIKKEYSLTSSKIINARPFSRYEFRSSNTEPRDGDAYYNPQTNILKIDAAPLQFTSIELYKNSRLIYSQKNPPQKFELNLTGIYDKSGNLIIVTKQSNGMVGIIYVN